MFDNIPTQFPINMANLVIPESFEDCLSYEEQIMFLYSKLQDMGYEVRYVEDGGQPDVEFVQEYVDDELTGIFIFKNLKGDKGDKGEPGDAQYPDITANATVSNTTGTPSCSVVRTGTASNPIYTFHFVNVKGEQGEKGDDGEQGEKGETGSTPDISMTASVSNTAGTPSVVVTKDDTDPDNVSFALAFSGLKGVQGDKGDKGDKGDTGNTGATGATPNIQMSATADATSSVTPTVTITKGGTDENPTFALAFSGLKGAKGDPGGPGSAPELTATASVDATSGTPDVVVTKSGTSLEPNFDFAFTGLKGADGADGTDGVSPVVNVTSITGGHNIEIVSAGGTTDFDVMDGEQGEQGPAGQDGTDGVTPSISATATVDSNVGTPAVSVVKTGTDASPNFAFNFSNVKGAKGDTGATPVISASATVDANVGTPAVNVTKSGTDASPSFAFAFSNIKGQQGAPGQDGVGVPTGGTTGQVLSKHSGTNYDTEWRDVNEVPDTTGANNGDVLTKAVSGPMWAAPVKELPTYNSGDADKVLKVNAGGTGVEWGQGGGGTPVDDDWYPFDQRTYEADTYVNLASGVTAKDASGNDIVFDEGTYLITLKSNPPYDSGGSSHYGNTLLSQAIIKVNNTSSTVFASLVFASGSFSGYSGYAEGVFKVSTDGSGHITARCYSPDSSCTYVNARNNSGSCDLYWSKIQVGPINAVDLDELPVYGVADAGKALKVNSAGTGVEWGTAGGGVDHTAIGLTTSYSGNKQTASDFASKVEADSMYMLTAQASSPHSGSFQRDIRNVTLLIYVDANKTLEMSYPYYGGLTVPCVLNEEAGEGPTSLDYCSVSSDSNGLHITYSVALNGAGYMVLHKVS